MNSYFILHVKQIDSIGCYTQLLCSIKFIEFANDKNIMQFSFISHVIVHSVDLLSLPIFLPIQFNSIYV